MRTKSITKLILAAFLSIPCLSHAQQAKKTDNGYAIEAANKAYGDFYTFHSDTMNKDFPVLVFLPENYGKDKKEFPVVYMLHGANGAALTEEGVRSIYNPKTGFKEAATDFQVVIVCPLVGNKSYLNSPINKEDKYASLIAFELVRFTESKFKVIKNRENRILAGFSMGAYGSVSLVCRYPDIFSGALARGGGYDSKTMIEELHWDESMSKGVLGSYWEYPQNHHLNSCLNLMNRLKDRKDVCFVIEIGREDFLYRTNKKLEAKLKDLSMPYIYAEYPGGHVFNKNIVYSLLTHLQFFKETK